MKNSLTIFVILFTWLGARAQPICFYPDNPHYFLYNGKPTLLVSGYMNVGNKFNLIKWNTRYFKRLKDFRKEASDISPERIDGFLQIRFL